MRAKLESSQSNSHHRLNHKSEDPWDVVEVFNHWEGVAIVGVYDLLGFGI